MTGVDDSDCLRSDTRPLLRSAELGDPGGPVLDLLDGAQDHRSGAPDRPAHLVPWAVVVMYLRKPPFGRHGSAVRAGGHVAVGQHAGQGIRCRLELGTQDAGKPAFFSFDDGAGVMGDQPAQDGAGVPGIAQVPGAVELVQARDGQAGCVADIVQPRGGFHEIGIRAENGCQAAGPVGDALNMRPAAGERLLEESPGELLRP